MEVNADSMPIIDEIDPGLSELAKHVRRTPSEEFMSPQAGGFTPATKRAGNPATKRAGKPATKRAGNPATKRAGKPATKRAGKPATKTSGKPATKRAGKPATKRAGKPATKTAGKPEELDFIPSTSLRASIPPKGGARRASNYDIKYRMGKERESDE